MLSPPYTPDTLTSFLSLLCNQFLSIIDEESYDTINKEPIWKTRFIHKGETKTFVYEHATGIPHNDPFFSLRLKSYPLDTEIRNSSIFLTTQRNGSLPETYEGNNLSYQALRRISTPHYKVKKIWQQAQKDLKTLISKYPDLIHPNCYGFVPGLSSIDASRTHFGSSFILSMDVKNFFDSITDHHFYTYFLSAGLSSQQANNLSNFLTTNYEGRSKKRTAPQGSPFSPILSALCFYSLDKSLDELRKTHKIHSITRYADDITMSFIDKPDAVRLEQDINNVLRTFDLRINHEKTEWMPHRPGFSEANKKTRKQVLGIVLEDRISVPREHRRLTRAAFHNLKVERDRFLFLSRVFTSLKNIIDYSFQVPVNPETPQQTWDHFFESGDKETLLDKIATFTNHISPQIISDLHTAEWSKNHIPFNYSPETGQTFTDFFRDFLSLFEKYSEQFFHVLIKINKLSQQYSYKNYPPSTLLTTFINRLQPILRGRVAYYSLIDPSIVPPFIETLTQIGLHKDSLNSFIDSESLFLLNTFLSFKDKEISKSFSQTLIAS